MMPQHYDTMQYTNIGMVCHTGLFVLCKISATKDNRPPLHYTTTRHNYHQLKTIHYHYFHGKIDQLVCSGKME